MKDLHESLTGHKWVDEKTVKTCFSCARDFTIKRRKVSSLVSARSWTLIFFYLNSIIVEIVAMFSVAPVPAIQWSWPLIRNLCAFVTRVIRYFLLGSPHKHPTINTVHCIRKIVPLNSFFLFSTLWQNAITHRLHTHHHTIINQKFKALHPFTSYLFMKKNCSKTSRK